MSIESYQKAIEVCRDLIGIKNPVTDEDIDYAVNKVVLIFQNLSKDVLKTKLMSIYSVRVEPMQILEGR